MKHKQHFKGQYAGRPACNCDKKKLGVAERPRGDRGALYLKILPIAAMLNDGLRYAMCGEKLRAILFSHRPKLFCSEYFVSISILFTNSYILTTVHFMSHHIHRTHAACCYTCLTFSGLCLSVCLCVGRICENS